MVDKTLYYFNRIGGGEEHRLAHPDEMDLDQSMLLLIKTEADITNYKDYLSIRSSARRRKLQMRTCGIQTDRLSIVHIEGEKF